MFTYEDLDYQSLTNDPGIDPDSPEALYALAQFCRMGKGTPPSEEQYRQYLERAAQAGSGQARQELDAVSAAPAAQPEEEIDPSTLSLGELVRLADKSHPKVVLAAAQACAAVQDAASQRKYLELAAGLTLEGAYTPEQAQDIWLQLAALRGQTGDLPGRHQALGQACEFGSAQAALALAEDCRTGRGCEKNEALAQEYERRGAGSGSPEAKYHSALRMLRNGNKLDAMALLEDVELDADDADLRLLSRYLQALLFRPGTLTNSDRGWLFAHLDEEGRDILAQCYETGCGVPKDTVLALALRSGIDPADAYSLTDLGIRFEKGQGQPQNSATAAQLFQQAANLGNPDAVYHLGLCCAYGKGMARNDVRAAELFRKAVDMGQSDALYELGLCLKNGRGVPRDDFEAAQLFRQAVEHGDDKALGELGLCYASGQGLEKDPVRAAELFRRAADLGDTAARYQLAVCYQEGLGVEPDPQAAVQLYRQCADAGYDKAWNRLGECYQEGIGVTRDPAQAKFWFERAGNRQALDVLQAEAEREQARRRKEEQQALLTPFKSDAASMWRYALFSILANCSALLIVKVPLIGTPIAGILEIVELLFVCLAVRCLWRLCQFSKHNCLTFTSSELVSIAIDTAADMFRSLAGVVMAIFVKKD